MNYQPILNSIQDHVTAYYKNQPTNKLFYHNLQHTKYVVDAAARMIKNYKLDERDCFIVLASAWFHDTGYNVSALNHEEESAKIARNYLLHFSLPDLDLTAIEAGIMATKLPQKPANLLQQIICDADMYHLGRRSFFKKNKLLFKEYNSLNPAPVNKTDWRTTTIQFLEHQNFFTAYARHQLDDTRIKNIALLKKEAGKSAGKIIKAHHSQLIAIKQDEVKQNKVKNEKPEKGIESMFRISSSTHQRLSYMADQKAHIMITVNSIILSAIISLVLRKLDEYRYLLFPSVLLMTVSILTMTLSILSTRPSIPKGTFTRADVDEKKVNLMFFGNFYKMDLEDYSYGILKMMEDREFLYGSFIKDIYYQGVIIGKKYHLLRIAYSLFMYGLIVAILAFIISSIIFIHQPVVKP